MKISPEPLPEMLPSRPKTERDAAGNSLQLMRQQRSVCGDHNDDRANVGAIEYQAESRSLPATPAMRRRWRTPKLHWTSTPTV